MAIESNLSHAFNDGFENFFNNESLSDRILCICEVEEVSFEINFFCSLVVIIKSIKQSDIWGRGVLVISLINNLLKLNGLNPRIRCRMSSA